MFTNMDMNLNYGYAYICKYGVNLSIYLSIYLSVYLSIYLSIYLSMYYKAWIISNCPWVTSSLCHLSKLYPASNICTDMDIEGGGGEVPMTLVLISD